MAINPSNNSRIRVAIDYPGLEGLRIQTTFGELNGLAVELMKNNNNINEIYNNTKNKLNAYVGEGGALAPMTQNDMDDFFKTLLTWLSCEKILYDKDIMLCFLDGQ
jgi:hypothetical protein